MDDLSNRQREILDLIRQTVRRRGFVVDFLPSQRARYDLHRSVSVVAPRRNIDPGHAAASRREEGGVPVKQPFIGQGFVEFFRGVEHHFDNALNIPVSRHEPGDVHAQPSGYR